MNRPLQLATWTPSISFRPISAPGSKLVSSAEFRKSSIAAFWKTEDPRFAYYRSFPIVKRFDTWKKPMCSCCPGATVLNVPGKFYEYMATRKPILALTRKNTDLADLIARASCGWVLEPDDEPALTQFLADLASEEGRIVTRPNSKEIQSYTRKQLASRYASVIREAGPDGDQIEHLRWATIEN